jgi:uncharacterized protein YndB with AHSA1/START domain
MGTAIGLISVRRSIWIAASPDRIWQEFTTFDRLARWFGTGHELVSYDPGPAGRVELRVQIDGEWRHFGGRIVTFEPHAELTFEDDWIPNAGWLQPSQITLRLSPFGSGTVVELFHHGFERTGPNFGADHEGYEQGWDVHHLVDLKRIVSAA